MFQLSDWIPSLTTAGLLGIAGFLSRNIVLNRLKSAVQHEYNVKLETLRLELSTQEKSIETAKHLAISTFQDRSGKLFEKRLEAIDLLWRAVCDVDKGRMVAELTMRVKVDKVKESIETEPKLQNLFDIYLSGLDLDELTSTSTSNIRPYLSKSIWSLYGAYCSIILFYVMQAKAFREGRAEHFMNENSILELIKSILPHQRKFLEEYGLQMSAMLLDEIKDKILEEIQKMLDGEQLSKNELDRAAIIQRQAEDVMKKVRGREVF